MMGNKLDMEELTQVSGGKIDKDNIKTILKKLLELGYSKVEALSYLSSFDTDLDKFEMAVAVDDVYTNKCYGEPEIGGTEVPVS